MDKITIIVGFPILSKLVRGNSVELSNCVLIPDDQLFNESKNVDCCVPMDAKTELVEESPSASTNTSSPKSLCETCEFGESCGARDVVRTRILSCKGYKLA